MILHSLHQYGSCDEVKMQCWFDNAEEVSIYTEGSVLQRFAQFWVKDINKTIHYKFAVKVYRFPADYF